MCTACSFFMFGDEPRWSGVGGVPQPIVQTALLKKRFCSRFALVGRPEPQHVYLFAMFVFRPTICCPIVGCLLVLCIQRVECPTL